MNDRIKFEDKSYGMIDVSRGTIGGMGKDLFGTDIKHNNVISLTINKGIYERGLNSDYYYSGEQLIKIDLSPVQFAEAITNMNTSGVPCTITRIGNEMINPVPKMDNKKEMFRKEFEERVVAVNRTIKNLTNEINAIMNSKKNMNKGDKESILSGLEQIQRELISNMPYVVECFDEQMEKSVSHSKAEIEAYVQNKIVSLGLKEFDKLKEIEK